MIYSNDAGRRAYDCRGHVSDEVVKALLYSDGHHWLTVWFAPLSGTQEVVGLEILPASQPDSDHPTRWAYQAVRRLPRWAKLLDAGRLTRITYGEIRSLPFKQFFADLQRQGEISAAAAGWAIAAVDEAGLAAGLTTLEMSSLDYLNDALVYSMALLNGNRAPAKAVAEVRSITVRSAQGRIAKARALGYLTTVGRGSRTSELTAYAQDLAGRLTKFAPAKDGN